MRRTHYWGELEEAMPSRGQVGAWPSIADGSHARFSQRTFVGDEDAEETKEVAIPPKPASHHHLLRLLRLFPVHPSVHLDGIVCACLVRPREGNVENRQPRAEGSDVDQRTLSAAGARRGHEGGGREEERRGGVVEVEALEGRGRGEEHLEGREGEIEAEAEAEGPQLEGGDREAKWSRGQGSQRSRGQGWRSPSAIGRGSDQEVRAGAQARSHYRTRCTCSTSSSAFKLSQKAVDPSVQGTHNADHKGRTTLTTGDAQR